MVYPEGTDAVTPLQEVIKQAIPAAWTLLSDSDVLTPASGVTLNGARAAVIPGVVAAVHIQLATVALSAGEQNVSVGSLASGLWPVMYFASLEGWNGGGVTALASNSSGGVSVRWASRSSDGSLVLTGTWPIF